MGPHDPRRAPLAVRTLVALLPKHFRTDWGVDLETTVASRLAAARGHARRRIMVHEITSLAYLGVATRFRRTPTETPMYFEPDDNRPLRVAWAVALTLHFLVFTAVFPGAGDRLQADQTRDVVVLTRYVPRPPPDPELRTRTVKRRVRPVPIPDPDPFDPEPVIDAIYDYDAPIAEVPVSEFAVSAPRQFPRATPDVVRGGVDVQRPQLIDRVEPRYAELALRARLQCFVVLEARIDRTGRVVDVSVRKPCGLGLDEAAVEAVSRWRYAPTLVDGRPVEVLLSVKVDFRLR